MRERAGIVVTRFAFGALAVALGLAAAFLLWLDSTHLEAEYLGVMGFKLGLRPAGITLAVLATFAARSCGLAAETPPLAVEADATRPTP